MVASEYLVDMNLKEQVSNIVIPMRGMAASNTQKCGNFLHHETPLTLIGRPVKSWKPDLTGNEKERFVIFQVVSSLFHYTVDASH